MQFIPQNAGLFLTKVFHKYFIGGKPIKQAIRTFLFEETSIGTHSDVLVYYGRDSDGKKKDLAMFPTERSWVLYKYSWAHYRIRPFTVVLPIQCLSCRRLHSIEGNAHVEQGNGNKHVVVVFLCAACGTTATHTLSPGLRMLEDGRYLTCIVDITNWSSNIRGEWCYEVVRPAAGHA